MSIGKKAMTKKGYQIFGQEKCTPQGKSWLRLCPPPVKCRGGMGELHE